VPLTPLRMPPIKSLRTLFLYWLLYWPVSRASRRAIREARALRRSGKSSRCSACSGFRRGHRAFPKTGPLRRRTRRFRRRSRRAGLLRSGEKITENEPHASLKMQLNLIDDRICQRAMRAFIIAVFNKRDRRVCRSADVITLRDRRFQGGHVRLPDLRAFRGRQECYPRRD
jgi:hypothetical protein